MTKNMIKMYNGIVQQEFINKIEFRPILTLSKENLKFRYRITEANLVAAYMVSKRFRDEFDDAWMVIYVDGDTKQILKKK